MIKTFDGRRRILFFPKAWANAVTRWIQGVSSPTGTILIRNTLNPGEGKSIEIDVDVNALIGIIEERLRQKFVSRDGLRNEIDSMVDGHSIILRDGVMSVNAEWINSKII